MAPPSVVELRGVVCRFGSAPALAGVDLVVRSGAVHALLGPNGAGKTTLLRVVAGLQRPNAGFVRVAGHTPRLTSRVVRRAVGVVASGTRSFYLRISGLENLVFFARLHGLRRTAALARARECLDAVGLKEAANKRVGLYSQGMQRRLAVARALLGGPSVLVIDEATHDLDPEGAQRVRALVADQARAGAAVLWATQRLDEIRGFAHAVTVLHDGRVAFSGTVPELVASATTQQFLIRVRLRAPCARPVLERLRDAIGPMGGVDATADPEDFLLRLRDEVVLGDALAAVARAGLVLLACREEQSLVEAALLHLRHRVPTAVTR
ncbi:MAG: ABC transporter ATP-binding protein [Actinomycetota bacterium]|nr:ABC transporter ATP-binding protein [Actinomycetota bacterium]